MSAFTYEEPSGVEADKRFYRAGSRPCRGARRGAEADGEPPKKMALAEASAPLLVACQVSVSTSPASSSPRMRAALKA